MEACVDCVQSALNAVRGGVKRIELCSALSEGGLTPSAGLLKIIKSQIVAPVFCMIRPRDGDFLYNELEVQVMEEDIKILLGCELTFHRAIDLTEDIESAAETIKQLGFSR
ncbi:copper homeostasis protein cutC homolog [Eurytemora carolleeae]|uniref:copper homeostasis protein cutC homolog n=1 Tax=Eurytemora carolleeae TaxID=1294199 RepID=UPI000C784259|nr:copper homeostasis protein cutC homolog [Eurytemora carolleeae]|eukprot:XP_023322601.1 copper homeostasis protein cutC homolog [Eurytemora affinis]